MATRQPVSVPGPTLERLRAIRMVEQRGTYGEVIARGVDALLASDKELAAKVAKVLEAVAA